MRESIFNILADRVKGAVVLDLFAGTGALGLEALSRGARSAVFVDNHRRSLDLLAKNIEACRMAATTRVIRWDIGRNLTCLSEAVASFDLVFMDPPYSKGLVAIALVHLDASGALGPGACIVIEHAADEALPQKRGRYHMADQRKYGKTLVSFIDYVI